MSDLNDAAMSDERVRFHHDFEPEFIEKLGQPEPTEAQWRCAAAEILARQRWRCANVDKLIEDAGVLARWLEYGWSEKP
jgi:hypothetical protein